MKIMKRREDDLEIQLLQELLRSSAGDDKVNGIKSRANAPAKQQNVVT